MLFRSNKDKIFTEDEKKILDSLGLNGDFSTEITLEDNLVSSELPEYIAHAGSKLNNEEKIASKEDIIEALKTVSDPEIMINIYDMGLVYDINIDNQGDVKIDMTVTAPTCPVAGILPQQAADAVSLVEGTGEIEVKIVWEPAWTPERMTDEAKMMIELF